MSALAQENRSREVLLEAGMPQRARDTAGSDLYGSLMNSTLGSRRTSPYTSTPASFDGAFVRAQNAQQIQLSQAEQWAVQNLQRKDEYGMVARLILQSSGLLPSQPENSFAPTNKGPNFNPGGSSWNNVGMTAATFARASGNGSGAQFANGVANFAGAMGSFQTGPTNDPTGRNLNNFAIGSAAFANTFADPNAYRLAVGANALANFQRGSNLTTSQQFGNFSVGFDAASRMTGDQWTSNNLRRAAVGANVMQNFNFGNADGKPLTGAQQFNNLGIASQAASLIPNQDAQRLATGGYLAAQVGANWNRNGGASANLGNAALLGSAATYMLPQGMQREGAAAVNGVQIAKGLTDLSRTGTSMSSAAAGGYYAAGASLLLNYVDVPGEKYINVGLQGVGIYSQASALGLFGGGAGAGAGAAGASAVGAGAAGAAGAGTAGAAATGAVGTGGVGAGAVGSGTVLGMGAAAWTGVGVAVVAGVMIKKGYDRKMENMRADHGTAQTGIFSRLSFTEGQEWDPQMSVFQKNLTNALAGKFNGQPGQKIDQQTFKANLDGLFATAATTTGGVDKIFHDTRNELNNMHTRGELTDAELVNASRSLAQSYESVGNKLFNATKDSFKQEHALRTKSDQLGRQTAGMIDSLNEMFASKGISTQIERTANAQRPANKQSDRVAAQWA
ncbi:MAG: hypothetical protein IT290_01505 [Deltaproteobacteria bacterium]|nr:hypothetical protein [Deltaproteobacteria bacterium]